MKINKLFEEIQENIMQEDLNGEFLLQGNCIIWTYDLDNDIEEIPALNEEDDDINYGFDSLSPEELLMEAYAEDKELVDNLLDELDEVDNWTFSEPEIVDNSTISFKIF